MSALTVAQLQDAIEDIARDRDKARSWAWRLVEAIDELNSWEPGRRGYADALRRLREERDWAMRELSGDDPCLGQPTDWSEALALFDAYPAEVSNEDGSWRLGGAAKQAWAEAIRLLRAEAPRER